MFPATLNQVYMNHPEGKPFSSWVLLLCRNSKTKQERQIRKVHGEIETGLMDHNVCYSDITTKQGRAQAYKKFGQQKRKHPLFIVLNKHPLNYIKNDPFMLVEWGLWTDIEVLKDDISAFVDCFSDEKFRNEIASAQNKTIWGNVKGFVKKNGGGVLGAGATIAAALL